METHTFKKKYVARSRTPRLFEIYASYASTTWKIA